MKAGAKEMRRAAGILGLAAWIGCSAALAFAGGRGSALPIFTPDRGKFRIMVNGVQAGEETFDIGPEGGHWIAHGSTEIRTASGVTHVSGDLELNPDGSPARYRWSTQAPEKASATITFRGPTATIDLTVPGKQPYTQQFTFASPKVVILDNNLYDQFEILARLYDSQKGGEQTFPVMIPQELTPGSVAVTSLGDQESDGKELQELEVKTADLQVDLFLQGKKLVRIVSPSANAEIDRE